MIMNDRGGSAEARLESMMSMSGGKTPARPFEHYYLMYRK